jgi:drug/metabolite transporter (DMT)-like permease
VSACCFGSIPILTSIANATGATLISTLVFRYVLATALLVVVSGGVASVLSVGRRAIPLIVLAGAGQAAIAYVSLSALAFIPAGTLTFLFYTYPAWLAAITAARRTEVLTRRRLVALALSLMGILAIVGAPQSGALHASGVALALTAALIYAAYIPMLDHLRADLPATIAATYTASGAAITLVVAGLLTGRLSASLPPTAWIAIGALALFCTALAFVAFLAGLARLGPMRTAIVSTIEPFWAAILGALVLSQPITAGTLVGGAFIAGAVILLQTGA